MLLCFAPQGDRGAPGPEGEKVGTGGWGLGVGGCLPSLGDALPGTFLFLFFPSFRVKLEPRDGRGHQAER